ncbi:MAG: cupin domain-containing protein [Mesorhizobium sp.]|nr:MAG: cupin domain-containing protein [Mesorhizobium sp.]TIQ06025.1 MAG: cupin domain-containing protein [Mesorhizobium sp.]TIR51143.1 MAG: cupin domain-containing protein [Mesorhizobium sp.]TJV95292.1 MAG: cupin domain-containing protein [Mesorhizobium sp.]
MHPCTLSPQPCCCRRHSTGTKLGLVRNGEWAMHKTMEVGSAISGLTVGVTTSARETGAAKLQVLHREVTAAMPKASDQEIRVLLATLEPGDCTPYHSHRFPVTVYMLEGTFTLELDGRETVTVKAGEIFVEPPLVKMTGRNLDARQTARMVLFYVSDPDMPFADPAV